MNIAELITEAGKQKIDYVKICEALEIDTTEIAVCSAMLSPAMLIALGMAMGVLYARKLEQELEKKPTVH